MTKELIDKVKVYIKKARYDRDGQMIWAVDGEKIQHLCDIRGWGHLQNKFKTQQEAADFQDAIGVFITDAINKALESIEAGEVKAKEKPMAKRLLALQEFRETHRDIIATIMRENGTHLSAEGRLLVIKARACIGYSNKTSDCDIFRTIVNY